jgi:hypothetical protein
VRAADVPQSLAIPERTLERAPVRLEQEAT